VLANQLVPPAVANLHRVFQHVSHNLVRQIAGDALDAAIPKTDPPILVHDVNPDRQVFHQVPKQLWVFQQIRKHGKSATFRIHRQYDLETSRAREE
jgi:hypothetical protein